MYNHMSSDICKTYFGSTPTLFRQLDCIGWLPGAQRTDRGLFLPDWIYRLILTGPPIILGLQCDPVDMVDH